MRFARVLAGAALAALSVGAEANELQTKKSPPEAAAGDWSGFYVGLHAGELFQGGALKLAPTGDSPVDAALNPNLGGAGFIGGALVGYNLQSGSTVYGVEADVGFGGAHSTVYSAKSTVPLDVWYAANKLSESVDGHLRARLGWAMGPVLLYGAGGLALSNAKLDVIGYCPPDVYPAGGSATLVGFSVGAGAEYALTPHTILRAEYLFDDYGHKSIDIGSGPPNYWQDREIDLKTQTVRLAIGYKF